MKHPSSRELFAYWNARRGAHAAPERAEIEPGVIRKVLGDTFILAFDPGAGASFRLAGTRVCTLFGRELKGSPFTAIFDESNHGAVRDLVAIVADEAVGVVAAAAGRTADGHAADLELLLLPLRHRGRLQGRMIGVLTPLAVPFWLGSSALSAMTLGNRRHVGPAVETVAAPLLAATPPRRRGAHGLVVYEGGRPQSPR